MNNSELQKAKNNDPNEDGSRMAREVHQGLGVPHGTSVMQWPRKPLGKPEGGKGPGKATQGKAPSRQGKMRGHVRGHSARKAKAPNYSGSWD